MCEACYRMANENYESPYERGEGLPTPNLALLRKVRDHIDNDPNSWDQNTWFSVKLNSEVLAFEDSKTFEVEIIGLEKCGTAACAAGWTVILGGDEDDQPQVSKTDVANRLFIINNRIPDVSYAVQASMTKGGDMISERAKELLGLTDIEASGLFNAANSRADLEFWFKRIAERAGEEL